MANDPEAQAIRNQQEADHAKELDLRYSEALGREIYNKVFEQLDGEEHLVGTEAGEIAYACEKLVRDMVFKIMQGEHSC